LTLSNLEEETMAELKEASKKSSNGPQVQVSRSTAPVPAASTAMHRSPFALMRRLADEMDRFVEDFGYGMGLHWPRALTRGRELLRREAGLVPAEWSPHVDILEKDGKLLVRADLPGMSKDDIKVEVTDDLLTIQGERKSEKTEEHAGSHYRECSYGTFYRAIPLPEGAETSKATAQFHNGVLEISIPAPRRSESKARRLEIHQGGK
jgi:HSP20 family protein